MDRRARPSISRRLPFGTGRDREGQAESADSTDGRSDAQIAAALKTNGFMVYRVSKQLIEGGLEAVLNRKPRSSALVRMSANGLGSSEQPTDKANLDLTLGGYLDERCP
jgi:hypothetical protein